VTKGFSYTLEDEKIIEYLALPVEDKLQWLEDINAFNELFLSEREKMIMDDLREGRV